MVFTQYETKTGSAQGTSCRQVAHPQSRVCKDGGSRNPHYQCRFINNNISFLRPSKVVIIFYILLQSSAANIDVFIFTIKSKTSSGEYQTKPESALVFASVPVSFSINLHMMLFSLPVLLLSYGSSGCCEDYKDKH